MTADLGVGLIGCGDISASYLQLAPLFGGIRLRACADLNMEAAQARASEYGIRAESVADLLAAPDIDIVVNLTVPQAHFAVSMQALEAGKHVYSEKPFVLSVTEGKALAKAAQSRGLRVGSAPDTFLGGTPQLARQLVDADAVGRIASGTCFVMSPGMEMWHPNPDFFFQPGGGPVLDLGPYYVSTLVHLLGPVSFVTAFSSRASETRTITSEPRCGEQIPVAIPTTIHAVLMFASGAQVAFCASWDVWHHSHTPIELYGRDGTLYLPDPNFFGGELRLTRHLEYQTPNLAWDHPFGIGNDAKGRANYRVAGLADLAQAVRDRRPHRCDLPFALHVVDVLTSILRAGDEGRVIDLTTTCERPAPLDPAAARTLLRQTQET